MKIPSTKNQISNKFQHAAQAPALRVTQIQNPKRKIRQQCYHIALSVHLQRIVQRFSLSRGAAFWSLDIEI